MALVRSRHGLGTADSEPRFLTSSMRERKAEKNGPRKTIFDVKPNPKYQAEVRFYKASERQPYMTGDRYSGEWKGDKKEGYGTKTWEGGNKYEGEWVGGMRHGKGALWVVQDGELKKQYSGDWAFDKREGTGVFFYPNGERYEGEWKAGKRHGTGLMSYKDKSTYEGDWREGKRSGLGVYKLPNGDRHEGHWLNDKKEGPGWYLFMSTRKVYEGEWVDDAPKCGDFKDMPPDLVDSAVPDQSFHLPVLTLKHSKAVLNTMVANIRNSRVITFGQPCRSFSEQEMDELKSAFARFDDSGEGTVPVTQLQALLQSVGLEASDTSVEALLTELQAGADSTLLFSEFVDILSLVEI